MKEQDKIVADIKPAFYLWFVGVLAGVALFIVLTVKALLLHSKDPVNYSIGWSFLFAGLLFGGVMLLKEFKYIVLKGRKMRVYSVFRPFGRTIDLNRHRGVITSEEYGSLGSYKTIYLVNKERTTTVKINGLCYRNFDELYTAIGLREIRSCEFTFLKYLQLIFTGRMKIETRTR